MNKITLNARELQDIMDMFNKINEPTRCTEFESIILEQSGESGIGSILKATMNIRHKEVEGEFTVIITDEGNW
jgi:hypothetical protein